MMKQRILKTIALGLMAMVGVNAWANDTSYVVYNETTSTGYTSLSDAIAAVTGEETIYVNQDVSVTAQIALTANQKVTLLAGVDNVKITNNSTSRLFLVNVNTAYLRIGDDAHSLIIDGNNKNYANGFISIETDYSPGGSTKNYFLTNVTIQNVNATGSGGSGYVYQKKNSGHANMVFKNVTFDNCKLSNTSSTEGIVRYLRDATLYLEGTINFNNCTGTAFYLDTKKAILRNNSSSLSDLTISNSFSVKINSSAFTLDQNVLVLFSHANAAKVTLANDNRGLYDAGNGSTNGDVKLTEAHTLNVTDAGAATLILPFASKIPSGVIAYTLTHTSGQGVVNASEAETALAANTPVLINAAVGDHKFINTARVTEETTGSGTHTVGALTGVYSDLTFTTENIASTYSNAYILNKIGDNVGFYKAAEGKKVGAYKAYLTAADVPAGARLSIVFDDSETTALKLVNSEKRVVNNEYYDLQGRRVAQPTKGLYIVNGKKVVIK